MFAVLCVEEDKRKRSRKKAVIQSVQTPVRGGAPFRIVSVTPGKLGIDWFEVARHASCGSRNMIIPENIKMPENYHLCQFRADTLPLLIMLNTAVNKFGKDGAAQRSIVIEDKNAVLAEYIDRIINCASKIKIVTDFPQKYYPSQLRMLEQYGASALICQQVRNNEHFDVAIASGTAFNAEICLNSATLFSSPPELPEEYARLCPQGIDRFQFLCALFECSAVKEIGNITLDSIV